MEISVSLADLPLLHPQLLWRDIRLAGVTLLLEHGRRSPFLFELSVREVPGFDEDVLQMSIESGRPRATELARVRLTYEPSRLVEFAAIAIAGLALYHAGEHQIMNVACRGSGADYLVDEERYPLEIAGRSWRGDLAPAWQERWRRLSDYADHDFFVLVAEFESLTGLLTFQH